MTDKEKAKAFDEALERFHQFKEKYCRKETHFGDVLFDKTGEMQKDFDSIFPQLAESEDERMRKAALKGIEYLEHELGWNAIGDTDILDVKEYLEKQKEHQNKSDAREKALGRDLTFPQDKDNDLDEIAQDYVNNVKEYNPEPTWDLMQTAVIYGYYCCEQKEQRELPFVKDVILGLPGLYLYDGERMHFQGNPVMKEKQKEPHYTKRNTLFDKCVENCDSEVMKEISNKVDEMLGKEQKSDTRDADDLQLLGFIYDLLNEIEWKDNWAMSKDECLQRLNNYRPQKPAEWNEEDERILKGIIGLVDHDQHYGVSNKKMLTWLKSLPMRCPKSSDSWKPSEEQMEALADTLEDMPEHYKPKCTLESLERDLKKLM